MKGKKLSKLIAGLTILAVMVTGASTTAYCWSAEEELIQAAPLNCQERRVDEWSIRDSLAELEKNEETIEGTLIHNNGKPIETNIFANSESHGNYLVAVYYTQENGVKIEHYFFTNEPDGDRKDLVNRVSESEISRKNSVNTIAASAKAGDEFKTYTWDHKKNSTLLATLSTNVTLKRKSSNATINGKKGSVWDVRTFTQLERVKAVRINGYRTRLSVDQTNQKLLSYGPVGDKSGGTVGVSLSATGVPSLSYSFSISGFSVSDLSSISKKYGRWNFNDNFGNLKSITTEPGIRASNTSGSFVTELSHVSSLNTSTVVDDTYQTGVIQIWVADR